MQLYKKFLMMFICCLSLAACASPSAEGPSPAIPAIAESQVPAEVLSLSKNASLQFDEPLLEELRDEEMPSLPIYKIAKDERTVAVQVLLIDCKNLDELDERISTLRDSGVNTLIFRVFHNKGDRFYSFTDPKSDRGVYFKTSHAPVVDDILGHVVGISHKRGMKVFAWMTTRYADYGVENNAEWHATAYDIKKGKYARARGLNLFNREVKNHIIGLYRDLSAYNIDGILFQDDLVLKQTEGFSHDARLAFAREYGQMPDPGLLYKKIVENSSGKMMVTTYGDLFWDWSRWKNRSLMNLASEIMRESKKVKGDMKFALNLMYEAALKPKEGLAWLSQDLDEAVKTGFDYYAIMAYHIQMGEELGLEGEKLYSAMATLVENALVKIGDPEKLMIKLQIADWKSKKNVSHAEMNKLLKVVRKKGHTSLAFVPYYGKFDFTKLEPSLNSETAYTLQARL